MITGCMPLRFERRLGKLQCCIFLSNYSTKHVAVMIMCAVGIMLNQTKAQTPDISHPVPKLILGIHQLIAITITPAPPVAPPHHTSSTTRSLDEFDAEPVTAVSVRRVRIFSSTVPICVVDRSVNSSLVPIIEDFSRVHARPLITRSTISCGARHCGVGEGGGCQPLVARAQQKRGEGGRTVAMT